MRRSRHSPCLRHRRRRARSAARCPDVSDGPDPRREPETPDPSQPGTSLEGTLHRRDDGRVRRRGGADDHRVRAGDLAEHAPAPGRLRARGRDRARGVHRPRRQPGRWRPRESYEYCPVDQAIYVGQDMLWEFYTRTGDAGPAVGLAHEFGHHIQSQLGVPLDQMAAEWTSRTRPTASPAPGPGSPTSRAGSSTRTTSRTSRRSSRSSARPRTPTATTAPRGAGPVVRGRLRQRHRGLRSADLPAMLADRQIY